MSEVIYLTNVRLSFPHLKEAHASGPGAVPKYSADFVMPADHPGYTDFMTRYGALCVEKWGEHAQQVMAMVHADRKLRCYGDGSEKVNKKTFQPYDGYVGNNYLNASRDSMPQMIKPDGSAVDPANTMEYQQLSRLLYGGCYVNAAIKPWLQDNTHGRGVRCDLIAVQFCQDGEAFGEGETDASGMFGAVAGAPVPPAPPVAPAPAAMGAPGLPDFMQ